MTNFPIDYDDDTTLPAVNNNLTEIGAEAINALRDVAFNTQQYLGLGADGTTGSIAARLSVFSNPDGSLKSSALTSLGLVTLPITNDQIINNAGIPESKLHLDHRTQDLFNYIENLSSGVNSALGWINVTGSKLEPHLAGALYRHPLDQITVTNTASLFLKNRFGNFRNNTNSFTLINDINSDYLDHQKSDGSQSFVANIVTAGGSQYPSNYAHTSSGIYLNTSRFETVPQTAMDLQQFAEFVDSSSIFLLGARIQNLYSNGISRVSRSSSLINDGYGVSIIPPTAAVAYLLNVGNASSPFDNIDSGDDIIEFKPTGTTLTSNKFDSQFAQVKIGDIVRINYGTVEAQFIIKEKKYISTSKKFFIRIAGRNVMYSANAMARIDKTLDNKNKYGVLALAAANNEFSQEPSLIVGSSRGAQILGIGFDPDLFDGYHYNLYLALYPTGNPLDGYTILPAIDVTGDAGARPGSYTLDSIINSTNAAFRKAGNNYRFIAFSYQGDFGIMLADSYHNVGFSILNAVVKTDGTLDSFGTSVTFPNNVIDMFTDTLPDPLGFGPTRGNSSSPAFMVSYPSVEASQLPTKIFLPLKNNNYYINGVEKERLTIEPTQIRDGYGDGYWAATVLSINSSISPTGTTYRINQDLSSVSLKIGKTIVVQPFGFGSLIDFGRFIISGININCNPNPNTTDITVYDALHAGGLNPTVSVGDKVAIYFNSDSISFNLENSTDIIPVGTSFKRNFETYIDSNANSFTQERGRFSSAGDTILNPSTPFAITLHSSTEVAKINIVKISPKLRGYQFGNVNKITIKFLEYITGANIFFAQLASFDGITYSNEGPLVFGKIGEVIRMYDETNIDYIDVIFDINENVSSFFVITPLDIQLFPTLSLDDEIMLIGTCQLTNNITISYVKDERQFGNISEKDLSTSVLNYISAGDRYLHENGVIRGFDLVSVNNNIVTLTGGVALVNGKFIQKNNTVTILPAIKEIFSSIQYSTVQWALCINDRGQMQAIPLLDSDPLLTVPSSDSRTFRAINPINSLQYNLDASLFSNILNNRKDLTILYVIVTVTT